MLNGMSHWSQRVVRLLNGLIPSVCALCGGSGPSALCDGCRAQFFSRRHERCARCAIPLPMAMHACGACLKRTPAFDATVVATDYAPPMDRLVLALKFNGQLELGPLLASLIQAALLAHEDRELPMLLTAVPLGSRRLIERGYNQALEIARPLSRALGIGLHARLAVRQRETGAQALLHPDARRKNVRNAFVLPDEMIGLVHNRHVGVVDDVMTTGETLHEMARTLKRAGAARVTNLVFARTVGK